MKRMILAGAVALCMAATPAGISFAASPSGTPGLNPGSTLGGAVASLPAQTLTATNLGGTSKPLASAPNFSIQNTAAANLPSSTNIVLVPHSVLSGLSTNVVSEIHSQLNAGNFVIEWNDGSGNLTMDQLTSPLGVRSSPSVSAPKGSAVQTGQVYAVGLVKLPNGVIDHLTFTSVDQPDTFGPLKLESLWGGLMSVESTIQSMKSAAIVSAVRISPSIGFSKEATRAFVTAATAGVTYYEASNIYSYSNVGEVSATDDLTMQRVNNDTLSVWTDHLHYETIPGSVLYTDGETQYDGDMNTSALSITDIDYPDESVTATSPNSSNSETTRSISVGTSGVSYSWSWSLGAVSIINDSDTSEANWSLSYTGGSNAADSTYDATPGWQMTNSAGPFMFNRDINVSFHNTVFQTGSSYSSSTTVNEPDWS